MKNPIPPILRDRSLTSLLALGLLATPWTLVAQTPTPAPASTDTRVDDETVVLSPFTVSTEKDRGYAATNAISGSRVNTAIKDLPIPVQVITSEFIDDIGATNLRDSLGYVAGIELKSQNDLENQGAAYGSVYGPGGVNNPEGVTSNINQVQLKIRGFITNNTLRDGFLRGSGTDSVNIDRIEVVEGPNALLYGTGNFGGVVDYITKAPSNHQGGMATVSYGSYDFGRATLDVTGPISLSNHIDYRLSAALETAGTQVDYQRDKHFFIAPAVSWKPTPTTTILIDTEYGKFKQNGYGFQALRAAQGNSSTPINNDQLEAVAFYFPPGANPRSFNLSGPSTYNNQLESNVELKGTQEILKETEWLPRIDLLAGYNHSHWNAKTQNLAGQITGPIAAGQPGYALSQTIVTLGAENGLGGQTVANGNLQFGTLPNSVVKYNWNQNENDTSRDQERLEINLMKDLGQNHWYHFSEQVLLGYSEIYNEISQNANKTVDNAYSYKSPNDLSPIMFGKQGDGSADPAMYQNDANNITKSWDAAYYVNSYAKFLKLWGVDDRIILMNGFRHDKNDSWSTDTTYTWDSVANARSAGNTTTTRAAQVTKKSYQNGVIVKLTKSLSVYALRSQGFQPNFGTLHDAITGSPVGADTAKSEEWGVKFDFLDGKISGTISKYKVTKTAWTGDPWYAPAPLGHVKFDPNKPIVYNLEGGFNGQGVTGATQIAGVPATSQGAPVQTDPKVIAAWNAAVAAGAITHNSPISGNASDPNALYLNASNAAGAAYLDAAFASVFTNGGAWPGWLYQGNSINDLANINNATLDAAGFQNGTQNAAIQVVDEARGWDGTLLITPNDNIQIMLTASIDSTVRRLSAGTWPKYPYPQDRWASWYFPNGGFGLVGATLAEAYGDPTDTSSHKTLLYPGDDTPKNSASALVKYRFSNNSSLKGVSVGLGGNWHSSQVIFSGLTHGASQAQYTTDGKLLILTAPSQLTLNAFVKYDFKSYGHSQYVQANVDNLLDDRKLYGLIYKTPLTAKLSYGIGF